MRKFLKILVASFCGAAVLLAVAAIALRLALPPDKAKTLILRHAAANLGRQVEVGDVTLGLFSGLSASNFRVSEAPDFSQGVFVSSERLTVRIRLLPLLAKKIAVRELTLVRPTVRIVRFEDGATYNFSSLGGASTGTAVSAAPAPRAEPAPGDAALQLLVSRASIEEGSVTFVDKSTANLSFTAEPVNVRVRGFSLTAPMNVRADAKVTTNGAAFQVDADADAGLSGSADIRRLSVSNGPSALTLTGRVENALAAPALDVKAELQDISPAFVNALAPLPQGTVFKGAFSGSAQAKGTMNDLAFSGTFDFARAALAYGDVFSKPAEVPMTLSARGAFEGGKDLRLDDLRLALGGIEASASGVVADAAASNRAMKLKLETNDAPVSELLAYAKGIFPKELAMTGRAKLGADVDGTAKAARFVARVDAASAEVRFGTSFAKPAGVPMTADVSGTYADPAVSISDLKLTLARLALEGTASTGGKAGLTADLKSNEFPLEDVARLVPSLQPYQLSGPARLVVRLASPKSGLDAKGTFTLRGAALRYGDVALTKLSGPVDFTMNTVSIEKLTGKLNGEDLTLSVSGRDLKGPMALSGQLSVARVKIPHFDASGLRVKWGLTGVTPDLSRVTGVATLDQGAGEVKDIQTLVSRSTAARVLLMPMNVLQKIAKANIPGVRLPSLDSVSFRSISGDYGFRGGVMDVKSFVVDGTDLDANMTGSVGLAGEQPLDLKMTLKLAKGAIGGSVGGLVNDAEGRATLPLIAKGTVSDPKVKLDASTAGRQTLKNLKERLGEDPGKAIDGLLKGLLGK